MLTCKETARRVASGELERAPIWQRLLVRLHLVICRHCRVYVEQIRVIGNAARRAYGPPAGEDRSALERLENGLIDRARSSGPDQNGGSGNRGR